MGSGGTFLQLADYTLPDHVDRMIVSQVHGTGRLLCALRSGEFLFVDFEAEGTIPISLSKVKSRPDPVAVMQVNNPMAGPDDAEFLLCYNQSVVFKDAMGNNSRQFEAKFSSRPQGVGS